MKKHCSIIVLSMICAVVPALGQEKKAVDAADAAKAQVLQDALSNYGYVSLVKKDATIVEVVEELKRKSPWINIDLDPKGIRGDEKVTVELKEPVPFRTALDLIVKKAGLVIEEESNVLIRLSKPPAVTLQLDKADVRGAIDVITKVSGKNIIVDSQVSGPVTLNVRNVPWTDLLDNIVKSVDCTVVKEKGDILRIVPQSKLRFQLETRIFRLKYVQPPPSYKATISTAYAKGGTRVSSNPVDDFTILKILRAALTKGVGTLEYDIETNSVIINDTKPALDQIESMLAKLDVEPDQVMIDVTFVSTSNEDLLNFGTNYSFVTTGEEGLGMSTTPSPNTKETPFPFTWGAQRGKNERESFLSDYNVRAIFRAFKKDAFTKIVQRPTIPVLNNNEATIFVGETIHYAEAKTTTDVGGASIKTVGEAGRSPVNVGFQLLVIPSVVTGTNTIILTIIPTNNFLVGKTSTTVPGFNKFTVGADSIDLPQYSQTTVVTKIMLESDRTAVLGGLSVERTSFTDKKIPFFGDIPVLNILFKDSGESSKKDNLLIFITPRIVKAGKTTADNLDSVLKQRMKLERGKLDRDTFEKEVEKSLEKRSKEVDEEIKKLKQGE